MRVRDMHAAGGGHSLVGVAACLVPSAALGCRSCTAGQHGLLRRVSNMYMSTWPTWAHFQDANVKMVSMSLAVALARLVNMAYSGAFP